MLIVLFILFLLVGCALLSVSLSRLLMGLRDYGGFRKTTYTNPMCPKRMSNIKNTLVYQNLLVNGFFIFISILLLFFSFDMFERV